MDEMESLSHTKWECKYHVVFIPKCRRKTLYQELRRHWGKFSDGWPRAEGKWNRGRASAAGSCAHDDCDTAEVCGVASDWIYQRQECDSSGAGVGRAEAEFRRAALLGTRILGVHGGARRGGDSRLHPQAKGRRQAIGPAKSLAIDSHREVAQPCGAALASPAQPL